MLETLCHSSSCFVTLTYRDENLRNSSGVLIRAQEEELPASLQPLEVQHFLKRLRKEIEPLRIRYYVVGEYGDQTWRPHYHLALFGFEGCLRGRTKQKLRSSEPDWENCCPNCKMIGEKWSHGNIDVGQLTTQSAQYLAGYVTKKMTSKTDPKLDGRFPEFARMSLRPGIGADAMHEIASELMRFNLENTQADVPSALRHGSRLLPLGRYLRRKLRTLVGKDEKTPEQVMEKIAEEMRPLRESAFDASKSFKKAILEQSRQERRNFMSKAKLYERKKTL